MSATGGRKVHIRLDLSGEGSVVGATHMSFHRSPSADQNRPCPRIDHYSLSEIVENACHVALAAEAAQSQAGAGLHNQAIQTLLDAEPHLHDARKFLEIAAFVGRKTYISN